jgi:integrase
VAAIIEHVPARWRLSLRVLEQSGMRVGEPVQLE